MSSVRSSIHSSKTNRNGKNGGERIGGGGDCGGDCGRRESALVSFKHQCSCRYSLSLSLSPWRRRLCRVLRWRREREGERKERNIDNGFWGRCPFSFRDRGSEGGINPMSSHDAAAHLCVRTSLLPLACSFSYAPRRPGTKMGMQTRCTAP